MTRSETLGVIGSGAFGPTILLLYLTGFLTADLSFAIIGFSFAVALVPGVVENRRKRIGWSKRSCIMTGNNLFSFTVIFLTLGLPLTAFSELVSASVWTALLVQAFLYAKPKPKVKLTDADYQASRAILHDDEPDESGMTKAEMEEYFKCVEEHPEVHKSPRA
jgi:hypothetical protein